MSHGSTGNLIQFAPVFYPPPLPSAADGWNPACPGPVHVLGWSVCVPTSATVRLGAGFQATLSKNTHQVPTKDVPVSNTVSFGDEEIGSEDRTKELRFA